MRLATYILALAGALAFWAPAAGAVIQPPVTVDGPSTDILDFGGIAMAPDGSGGLVYIKALGGVPHVFAARFDGTRWDAPVRVDSDRPYGASEPRIAASSGGRLLVVWVAQAATVHNRVQNALCSASLGPGATGFGPSLVIDKDVGEGTEVDPDLAGTEPGKAIVAYRVVTNDFTFGSEFTTAVQLRPGDVMADIRLARFAGDHWSKIGPLNRNPASSMRPPIPLNAPKVAIGATGNAVVAWQEPDQSGTARIWLRRVFGTTPGPPIQASPSTWQGQPIVADADAIALDATALDQVRIAMRASAHVFLATMAPGFSLDAGKLTPPLAAEDAAMGAPGPPALAAADEGGGEGSLRLAFTAGGRLRLLDVDEAGALQPISAPTALRATPNAEAIAAVDPAGGGLTAYEASDSHGRPLIAARQEFASGAAQVGLLSGALAEPVSELRAGRSGAGDALIGFRQGEVGRFRILATRVSAPPAKFNLSVPERWVRPGKAIVRWGAAPSAAGNLTYAVLLDGHAIAQGLGRRRYRPRPALLGSGRSRVQVIATDGLGGQLASRTLSLRVDAEAPLDRLRLRGMDATVALRDPDSGVAAARCYFGDHSAAVRGKRSCRHAYQRPDTYRIAVAVRDRAGNRAWRYLVARVG